MTTHSTTPPARELRELLAENTRDVGEMRELMKALADLLALVAVRNVHALTVIADGAEEPEDRP